MDYFLQARTEQPHFSYKDVLVVGEQKKSHNTGRFKADILQLARYVRNVFTDQPTRRFVHAFTLCAAKMELWIFDRSGAYSSGLFDIHEEPDKFARALVGYATMDNSALGLDTFIQRTNGCRYVTLNDCVSNSEVRFTLKKAMVRQKAIVCRGTTCYGTENNHVAKFSWVSAKRRSEVDYLRLVEQRGVRGVARAAAYRQIITIGEMRSDLQFPKAHQFRTEDSLSGNKPSTTASNSPSSNKRKASHDVPLSSMSEPSKPGPSLYASGDEPYDDRVFSCLVVAPTGRVISSFTSVKQLLEAMRDAIKAHQSLYVTANILHRDISANNIIITEHTLSDGFNGMLIDLDLAKELDSGPSGARQLTGTMQFMAVEVLRKTDHTYRHDLESFFYVLLWMGGRQAWSNGFATIEDKRSTESSFRGWEIGSFNQIANSKEGCMTINGLHRLISEFAKSLAISLTPLCLAIRSILFGDTAKLVLGTPLGPPDQLYGPIIAAYDRAIDSL